MCFPFTQNILGLHQISCVLNPPPEKKNQLEYERKEKRNGDLMLGV